MENIHMFGISKTNGVKKHFFRPEKEHGFAPTFYSALHTIYLERCRKMCVHIMPPIMHAIFMPRGRGPPFTIKGTVTCTRVRRVVPFFDLTRAPR